MDGVLGRLMERLVFGGRIDAQTLETRAQLLRTGARSALARNIEINYWITPQTH